jgi:hypothetical protein
MAWTIGTISARTSSASNPILVACDVMPGERLLTLLVKTVGGTDRAGGAPTCNQKALTQASTTQKAATSPEAGCELWYLLNPPAGTGFLSIPNTGSATIFYQIVMARPAPGRSAGFASAVGANGTSTNPDAGNPSPVPASSFAVSVTAGGWTNFSTATPAGSGLGAVLISANDDGAHGGGAYYTLDAAATNPVFEWTFSTSDDWGAVTAVFNEEPAVSNSNYLHATADAGLSVTELIR